MNDQISVEEDQPLGNLSSHLYIYCLSKWSLGPSMDSVIFTHQLDPKATCSFTPTIVSP